MPEADSINIGSSRPDKSNVKLPSILANSTFPLMPNVNSTQLDSLLYFSK
jgi:hypothetical protein